jgi:CMP-N-acetylneuraminic acid synthetase
MKKEITCVVQARVAIGEEYGYKPGDHRIEGKMIRDFAGSTLLEVTLKKLKKCKKLDYDHIYLVACEDELIEVAEKLGVQVYQRSKESISKGATQEDLCKFVWDINSDYFMQISPCSPLLTPATIDKAIEVFQETDYHSLFGVVERKNYFFDSNSKVVSPFFADRKLMYTMNTKIVGSLYEAAHCIYIWNASRFKREMKRWDFKQNDPYLFSIPPEEAFDIDYPWQFDMAEAMYSKKNGRD